MVVQELNEGLAAIMSAENVYGVAAVQEANNGHWVLDKDKTSELRADIRKRRLKTAIASKKYIEKERKNLLEGKLAPIVKEMYNDSFNKSPRFLQEFKRFWELPDTFTGFKQD